MLDLKQISDGLCQHFEELVSHLNLKMKCSGYTWQGPCEIHQGDNQTALVLYSEGQTKPGHWHCYTRSCDNIFKNTILGFLRGILSQKFNLWSETGKVYPFWDTVKWAKAFLDGKPIAAKPTIIMQEKKEGGGLPRELVRAKLQIPSIYFLKRGFPAKLLDKYDVGYAYKPKSQMFQRSVIPVYDETGRFMVGCTGRSIHEECPRCHLYHSQYVPCDLITNKGVYAKWRHSKYFKKGQHLFNLWWAKKHIQKQGSCVLVEGPGDVLKLEMAGIHHSLATFGCRLSDFQQVKIEQLGISKVIILYDNDESGAKGKIQVCRKLKKSHKLFIPKFDGKDVGDLSIDEILRIDLYA